MQAVRRNAPHPRYPASSTPAIRLIASEASRGPSVAVMAELVP
jgi:hypothetical protein